MAETEAMDGGSVIDAMPPMTLPEQKYPAIKTHEEFEQLPPGSKYVDPEGATRSKPYMPKSAQEFVSVPEGAQYLDPEGKLREKPESGPLDFTAQTLYDMSITPSEKRKSLERTYPGKVKEDAEGLYVEDNGKFLRPGRGLKSVGAAAASAAAPTIGAVLGAIGGGVGGSAAPVIGTVAGGAAGGAGGAMLGQAFNDVVLQLAGVWDRTPSEELVNAGLAAASGAMGAGVGEGLGVIAPAIKAGVQRGVAGLPAATAHFLGAQPETSRMATQLAEKGVMVPPSAHLHESPHLQNLSEVFYQAFRTDNPFQKSAANYYEKQAGEILDELGVKRTDSLLEPTADIPTLHAGERILQRTLSESAAADQALKAGLEKRATALKEGLPDSVAQREAIASAAKESRDAAQKLIDQGFKDIESDANAAFKVASAGGNSGDLWTHVGNKLTALRRGISERARYWYDRYDEMTGGAKVSSVELSESAQHMLDELPAEFKARNPALVAKLSSLSTEEITYGQLHDLRSLFRGSADWHTLSSDFKNGALKRFSDEINQLIHDPNAPENVRNAAKFLDLTDKWYAHNIKIFEAQQIKTITKGLEAGEPADPANLYRAIVKEGHTDLTRRIRDMVGPTLWAGVRASDTRAMLDASKTLTPGVIDARKFAREVLDRHRANMLEVVHGKEASEKLLAQARAIEQLDGRQPVPARPDDTLTQVIARARLAADEAKATASKDPLGTLNKEMKKIQAEQGRELAKLKAERRNDPLGFLYNPTTGANEAVDKILGSEDLILAAAARFGDKSPEFNMLRQVYAQRVLQGSQNLSGKLAKISPEIQQLMFPGVTFKQMQRLAKEMEFLLDTRGNKSGGAGASMSAFSKVEHPVSLGIGAMAGFHAAGPVGAAAGMAATAVAHASARAALGKFFGLVTKLSTSPVTLRFIERGLEKGTPQEKEAIRDMLRKAMAKGAAVGAGTAEFGKQQ